MLGKLLLKALRGGRVPLVGPLLQPLLFGLAASLESEVAQAGQGALTAQHPVISLVLSLTVQVAPKGQHFLMTCKKKWGCLLNLCSVLGLKQQAALTWLGIPSIQIDNRCQFTKEQIPAHLRLKEIKETSACRHSNTCFLRGLGYVCLEERLSRALSNALKHQVHANVRCKKEQCGRPAGT